MAEDVWSGIMQGIQASNAQDQQDSENQQAEKDALAKQIAQQHTDQLEQSGLLIRQKQADTQATQVAQAGDAQKALDAWRNRETDRKTTADAASAANKAAAIKASQDRMTAQFDDNAKARVMKEADLFTLQGLDPNDAQSMAIANEALRSHGYPIPPGQASKPGTVKSDAAQLPGAPQPGQPQAGPMGPQPAAPMSGGDLMNQLMMPQPGQADPNAGAGFGGAPAAAPPAAGQPGQPASGPLPMVAARMGQMNANANLATAHAHNFDANTNATNVLLPLREGKIKSDTEYTDWKQQEGTAWHAAMQKHWDTQAAATKAYQDASLALRQNALNGRTDQKPIAEFRALAGAKAQMGNQLLGMDKQLQQMGKEKATLSGLMHSPRPDATADPTGARQWDLIQRVGPDRINDIDTRTGIMQKQFDAANSDMQTYRALLLTRTNLLKDNGTVNQSGTKQLQKAAGVVGVAPVPGPGQTRGGLKSNPIRKTVPDFSKMTNEQLKNWRPGQ